MVTPPVDFVIVTALEEEREALLSKLPQPQQLPPTDEDIRVYYHAQLPVTLSDGTQGNYDLIVLSLLNMGRVQATAATSDAIRRWQPRFVLLVGIAGGIEAAEIGLGDLLISDQIVDYELQKIREEGTSVRYEVHRAAPRLLGFAQNFKLENCLTLLATSPPVKKIPQRFVGAIASGDKVIAFGEVLKQHQQSWPKLIGVEMEAAGVATAAFQSANPPGFFMIRGVSDLADNQKDSAEVKQWRNYACEIAAAYTVAMLQQGPVPFAKKKADNGDTPSNITPKPPEPPLYNSATWVGRNALLEDLLCKLKGKTRLLWLRGISGVGKTALAECLAVKAWEETNPFHWVSLEIFAGQIPDFTTGAAAILAKLGDIDIDPQERNNPKRICDRLLRKLQSHSYWIQLDSVERLLNTEDSAFADNYWLTFLQQCLDANFPSRLIFTSQALPTEMVEWRDRYANVWHTITLPGLSAANDTTRRGSAPVPAPNSPNSEQLEFFSKAGITINKSNSSLLSQIGEIYEGHPLALQVIAGEIHQDYNNNVAQYWEINHQEFEQIIRELSSQRLSPALYNEELQQRIRKRIEKSLQQLPNDALNLLCRSSVYRRPVPKSFWLAMLWDASEKQQQQAYLQLGDRALIEKEGIHQNQRLIRQHNLVRDIAYDLLKVDTSTWQTAEHKAAELWLNEYQPADDAENIEKVRGYLEAFYHYCEIEDWEAASELFMKDRKPPSKSKLYQLLGEWSYYQEQLNFCKQLSEQVSPNVKVVCYNGIGIAHDCLANYPQAIAAYQRGLEIAKEIGDRRGEANALCNLGLAYNNLGKYQWAIGFYQQSLEIAKEIGYRRGEVNALGNLGLAYNNLGEYQRAIDFHKQSLEIAKEIGDHRGEGYSLNNLGLAYNNLGEYQRVIDFYQQSLKIKREISDRQGEGNTLCNLGETYIKLEEYDKALENLQQSLAIIREIQTRSLEAEVFKNLAELYHKTNQPQQAREHCKAALQIAKELGIPLVKECEELLALIPLNPP